MNINNLSDKVVHTLKLPYKGDHGTNLKDDCGTNLIESVKHQQRSHYLKTMMLGLF